MNIFRSFTLSIFSFFMFMGIISGQVPVSQLLKGLSEYSLNTSYQQLPLPYGYAALEPHIDAATMEIHYTKHHAAYTANLNKALEGNSWASTPLLDIFDNMEKYPSAVRNNGGGYYNHMLFWQMMKPNGGGQPQGALLEALLATFGSFEAFKKEFSQQAATRFGSGWAWLSVDPSGKLFVSSTANQDNPLMSTESRRGIPVLALDVWEHAYYLKFQNKRVDYISTFWNVVNWDEVSRRYLEALNLVSGR